jgi:hypothetical protein
MDNFKLLLWELRNGLANAMGVQLAQPIVAPLNRSERRAKK